MITQAADVPITPACKDADRIVQIAAYAERLGIAVSADLAIAKGTSSGDLAIAVLQAAADLREGRVQ